MKFYKLKVGRTKVGHTVPFPLVYVFEEKDLPKIRQAFPALIGFPVRHHLDVPWGKLKVGIENDSVTRKGAKPIALHVRKTLEQLIPDLMRKDNPWHIAVPIMSRNTTTAIKGVVAKDGNAQDLYNSRQAPYKGSFSPKDTKPVLGYLKDASWDFKHRGVSPYPSTAYFATKEKVTPSLCMGCPRYTYMLAGKCKLGDEVCFDAVRNFNAPGMFAKLRQYDALMEDPTGTPEEEAARVQVVEVEE